jgi:adenylate cyclase
MRRYRWTSFVPFLGLVAALTLRVADPPAAEALRNFAFDSFERWEPRPYVDAGIRVVDIDDESLARIGQWPWPRTVVAGLVNRLGELGVAAVAFDAIFSEPDRTSPKNVLPIWTQLSRGVLPPNLVDELPDHDAMLAQAVVKTPTVLGIVLTDESRARPEPPWGIVLAGNDVRRFLVAFNGAVENLPALEANAAGLGALNAIPDADGVIRRAPLAFTMRGAESAAQGIYPALAAEALRVAQRATTYVIRGTGSSGSTAFGQDVGVNSVVVGDLTIPTDGTGGIAFYDTGSEPTRTIPAWQVLEPGFDRARLAGTIVFVGTGAAGLVNDLRTTPLRALAPGVEVHAQIAEQAVLGVFLQRPNWMTGAELAWILVFCGGLLWVLTGVGPLWAAVIGVLGISASLTSSWLAFTHLHLLVDPVYPALTALALYTAQSLLHHMRTERDRAYLKSAFGRYVSPALLDQLTKDSTRLRLGGEMREMSILFCDIRGFTSLAETMDAEALTHFVNSFLTPMTEIILRRQGTIDKYIGDCIMAFWNAPLLQPQHAELAVRAALDMIGELVRLNGIWHAEAKTAGRPFGGIGVGIGIATGSCCVGNLGSEQRFDYSVLGDDVNLASRLEGQTKFYGLAVIISEATLGLLPRFAVLELDLLHVKGKSQARRIFAVLGDEETAGQGWFATLAADHQAMLTAFRAQRWSEAASLVEKCAARAPAEANHLYRLYTARIDRFRAEPPPEDWDGAMVAESK